MFNQIVLLCRPGFEKECAGEIMALATQHLFPAYIQTKEQSAYVLLVSSSEQQTTELITSIDFRQLIFTRQWFATNKETLVLPETDRLSEILKAIKHFDTGINKDTDLDMAFDTVELNYADTNEGKSLSKFCKQFKPHLVNGLKKQKRLSAHANWRLQLFFTDSLHVNIGISPVANSAPDVMGITRLKMPYAAPSRSTLKLEEAIRWFLSTTQQTQLIQNGMTVVDLGAAPGGWSWQFVQRDCLVTAIDNGPMQSALMQTGMVEHRQVDAFTYTPKKKVDWLLCDMAERPLHVSRLIARWFTEKQCTNAIFNLKLPMKKRLDSVHECLALLEQTLLDAGIKHAIMAKQLYHDREEITVCILCP